MSKSGSSSAASVDGDEVDECKVKVVVRCRPMNDKENSAGCQEVINCEPTRNEVAVSIDSDKLASFHFDGVFDKSSSQQKIYENVASDIVDEALRGYNCTIFAYGQTGTGKTFTMEGQRDERKHGSPFWFGRRAGIIPRATQHIFQHLQSCSSEYTVNVTYLELYNEELIDLLATDDDGCGGVNPRAPLRICYTDTKKGVTVSGLEVVNVRSPEDIFQVLERSAHKRHAAETLLNKNSSRSHCIFTITIHTKEITSSGEEICRAGKLNLVDLAGSENVKRSGAEGGRRKEAASINSSLLTLGRVITALSSKTKNTAFIPYRDSKLTRLLQESLGGKAKTCIIATISPSSDCLDETRATLQYALRGRSICNKPVVNQKLSSKAQKKDYLHEIESLKNQLYSARSKDGFYVPQSTWDEMQETRRAQEKQIDDLKAAVSLRDEEYESLQKMYERKSVELDSCIEKLNNTRAELEQTSASLKCTTEKLEATTVELSEKNLLLEAHKRTEMELTKEGERLIQTLSVATAELQAVHQKLARKTSLDISNRAAAEAHAGSVSQAVEGIAHSMHSFKAANAEALSSVCGRLASFVSDNVEGVNGLAGKAKDMAELIANKNGDISTIVTAAIGQITNGSENVSQILEQLTSSVRAAAEQKDAALRQYVQELERDAAEFVDAARSSGCAIDGTVSAIQEAVQTYCEAHAGSMEGLQRAAHNYVRLVEADRAQYAGVWGQLQTAQKEEQEKMQRAVVAAVSAAMATHCQGMTQMFDGTMGQVAQQMQAAEEAAQRFAAEADTQVVAAGEAAAGMKQSCEEAACAVHAAVASAADDCAAFQARVGTAAERQTSSQVAATGSLIEDADARTAAGKTSCAGLGREASQLSSAIGALLEEYKDGAETVAAAALEAAQRVNGASEAAASELREAVAGAQAAQAGAIAEWSAAARGVGAEAVRHVDGWSEDVASGQTPVKRKFHFIETLPSCPADEEIIGRSRSKRRRLSAEDEPEVGAGGAAETAAGSADAAGPAADGGADDEMCSETSESASVVSEESTASDASAMAGEAADEPANGKPRSQRPAERSRGESAEARRRAAAAKRSGARTAAAAGAGKRQAAGAGSSSRLRRQPSQKRVAGQRSRAPLNEVTNRGRA